MFTNMRLGTLFGLNFDWYSLEKYCVTSLFVEDCQSLRPSKGTKTDIQIDLEFIMVIGGELLG